jgi:hypothetical protein
VHTKLKKDAHKKANVAHLKINVNQERSKRKKASLKKGCIQYSIENHGKFRAFVITEGSRILGNTRIKCNAECQQMLT